MGASAIKPGQTVQTVLNIGHPFLYLVVLIFIAITNVSARCQSDEYSIMHQECCPACRPGKSEIPPKLINLNIDICILILTKKYPVQFCPFSVPQATMFQRTVFQEENTQRVCLVVMVLSTMTGMGLNNAPLAQTVLQV